MENLTEKGTIRARKYTAFPETEITQGLNFTFYRTVKLKVLNYTNYMQHWKGKSTMSCPTS